MKRAVRSPLSDVLGFLSQQVSLIAGIPGVIGYYDASGFVDDGSGKLSDWVEFTGNGLDFTQSTASRRVTIDGNKLDFGSATNGSIGLVAPTWPQTPVEVVVFMQHYDADSLEFDDYNDFLGGNSAATRFTTLGGGDGFWARQSGGYTIRNLIPTDAILPMREPIMLSLLKDAGLQFTKFGNRDNWDRSIDGEVYGLLVLSEKLSDENREKIMTRAKAKFGVKSPAEALGSYAAIWDIASNTQIYSKGSQTHSFIPDSMSKVITAMMAYNSIDDGDAAWDTQITIESGDGAATYGYLANDTAYDLGYVLHVAMLESNNKAAYAIGRWLGDEIDGGGVSSWLTAATSFIGTMGLTGTTLTTPDGATQSGHAMTVNDAALIARTLSTDDRYTDTPAGGVSLMDLMATATFAATGKTVEHSCPSVLNDWLPDGASLACKGGVITLADALGVYTRADGKEFAIVVADMPSPDTSDKRWADVAWMVERCESE